MMMMSLLQNPEKGGTPEMDMDAERVVQEVVGILPDKPPISFRFLVPVACSRAPEFRKRRLLKMEWLNR
jgi:hypothetical protein